MQQAVLGFLAILLYLTIPSSAGAYCGPSVVYITTDPDIVDYQSSNCGADVTVGEPITLYFVLVKDVPFDPISRLDFTISDWPALPAPEQGRMDFTWSADSIAGDLNTGLTLSWSTPLLADHGDVYVLGSVEIESHDPAWLTDPLLLEHEFESGSGWNDWDEEFLVLAGRFGFNMAPVSCNELIVDPWNHTFLFARHIVPGDGSAVPPQFDLEFDVIARNCGLYYLFEFTGVAQVLDQSFDLEGIHFASFSFPIDASGVLPGAPIPVTIDLEYFGEEAHHELEFIRDDTSTAPTSFSAIKTKY